MPEVINSRRGDVGFLDNGLGIRTRLACSGVSMSAESFRIISAVTDRRYKRLDSVHEAHASGSVFWESFAVSPWQIFSRSMAADSFHVR